MEVSGDFSSCVTIVRALVQALRHCEEALGELGEFARSVARQGPDGAAVALSDLARAVDEGMDRTGDEAGEGQADETRHEEHDRRRERDATALVVELADDVARRARGVDNARDAAPGDDRHGGEDAHRGAAADRIDGRRRMARDAAAQDAAKTPRESVRHLLDMGERAADFALAGDDDTGGAEDAEPRERRSLRLDQDRRRARPDLAKPRRDLFGRRPRFGARAEDRAACEVEPGLDRRIRLARCARVGHRDRAGRDVGAVGDLGAQGRREHGALADQFGLRPLDELVLVEAKEEEADERQRQHRPEDERHDEAEARAPFPRHPLRGGWRRDPHAAGGAAQGPSLKPIPWIVTMPLWHPAAASFARMLRMWLSTVRSETWIAGP